jgi:hypothetical protein
LSRVGLVHIDEVEEIVTAQRSRFQRKAVFERRSYTQGVKANVLFFDRSGAPQSSSDMLWVYICVRKTAFRWKRDRCAVTVSSTSSMCTSPMRDKIVHHGRNRPDGMPSSGSDCSILRIAGWIWMGSQCRSGASRGLSRLNEVANLIADDLRHALTFITHGLPKNQLNVWAFSYHTLPHR